MEESEEMLLNGLGESVRRVSERLMSEGKDGRGAEKTGEEVLAELISTCVGESRQTLLRIQSYYNQIIRQLNSQIQDLQHQLNKMNAVASQDKILQHPPATLRKRGISTGSPKSADISFEDDELTYTKTKFVRQPSATQSIVFDYEDDRPTQKKDSLAPERLPLVKNVSQADRTVLFNQQRPSCFELELDTIKTQIRKIRSFLQTDGTAIPEDLPPAISTSLSIKLLQLPQTKNVKEHLINENLKLRQLIAHLKSLLSSLPAELCAVRQGLQQSLSCLQ